MRSLPKNNLSPPVIRYRFVWFPPCFLPANIHRAMARFPACFGSVLQTTTRCRSRANAAQNVLVQDRNRLRCCSTPCSGMASCIVTRAENTGQNTSFAFLTSARMANACTRGHTRGSRFNRKQRDGRFLFYAHRTGQIDC